MTQVPASPDTSFPGFGTESRLRAELEVLINELAAKHTKVAIVMPVKEILSATFRAITDLPRIPDYDSELAGQQAWRTGTGFSHTKLYDDPEELKILARRDEDQVAITVRDSDSERVLNLDIAEAEGFFLAGLAAVRHVKAGRQ